MVANFHDIGRTWAASLIALTALAGLPALGGENAILTNGFRIHADRHELAGNTVRLFSGGGFTEVPTSQIAAFEAEEYVPATVAPSSPVSAAPSAISATDA